MLEMGKTQKWVICGRERRYFFAQDNYLGAP